MSKINGPIYEHAVSEIIPGLWLGNVESAYDRGFLNYYNIKNILTVMDTFDYTKKYDDICYMILPIKDKRLYENSTHMINTAIYFIDQCIKSNQRILVHCKRGHHRSAAIVAAYLIKYRNYAYLDTIKLIHTIRPYAMRRDTNMGRALFDWKLAQHDQRSSNVQNQQTKNIRCQVDNTDETGIFYCELT